MKLSIIKEVCKFLFRFLLRTSLFLLVLLPLQLIGGIILLPVCYLYPNQPLPYYLKYFDNADQYVGRDTSTYMAVRASGALQTYLWLAWRNPLNYLGYTLLSLQIQSIPEYILHTAPDSYLVGDKAKPGFFYLELINNGSLYYEYYYIKTYTFMGTPKCFRFRMGHKIGIPTGDQLCQFVYVISPYHDFTGTI